MDYRLAHRVDLRVPVSVRLNFARTKLGPQSRAVSRICATVKTVMHYALAYSDRDPSLAAPGNGASRSGAGRGVYRKHGLVGYRIAPGDTAARGGLRQRVPAASGQ
jgi:hypothetical protein